MKAQADGKAAGASAADLGPVNFGPKYEQHVQELQKQIDEAALLCATCSNLLFLICLLARTRAVSGMSRCAIAKVEQRTRAAGQDVSCAV